MATAVSLFERAPIASPRALIEDGRQASSARRHDPRTRAPTVVLQGMQDPGNCPTHMPWTLMQRLGGDPAT